MILEPVEYDKEIALKNLGEILIQKNHLALHEMALFLTLLTKSNLRFLVSSLTLHKLSKSQS
jgi:hypothetical protein